jgi:hypothetical protein
MCVWIWHNGDDPDTLRVVRGFLDHPRVREFHHSRENRPLWEATNWLWSRSSTDFLAKVDDDCLVPDGWARQLIAAHQSWERFGALGCWLFADEDFVPELAFKKIREFPGGHRILQNPWVQGSGYVLKRRCVTEHGLLRPGQSFPGYLIELACAGWVHGWYFPFIREDHMDDPRSPYTVMKSDEDVVRWGGLSARANGITTLEAWKEHIQRTARGVQAAHPDPKHFRGWRRLVHRSRRRLGRLLGNKRSW